LLNLTLKHLFT